jgi:hypothetical protein
MSLHLPFPVVSGPQWPGVHYFCTTRLGGVSKDEWASFNLGFNTAESPALAQANRTLLHGALPCKPFWLNQVHGAAVVDADQSQPGPQQPGWRPDADAALTTRSGCVLGILTADCLPVVIADTQGRALGVAHAGWRGLAGGVLEETLRQLRQRAPAATQWQAWIGPGISQPFFEVGPDVYHAFVDVAPEADRFSRAGAKRNGLNRWQADLAGLAAWRLERAGVAHVIQSGRCTYGEPDVFYSYRRSAQTGRMATIAWLESGS